VANFNWGDNQARPFRARYSGLPLADLAGYAQWEALMAAFQTFNAPADAWPFLQDIRRVRHSIGPRRCPRLFVSHRQGDESFALRVAWCANQENVEYWIDVLNLPPNLVQGPQALAPVQQIILLAAIIEMALINCTHVTAVMTPATAPSRWVPYEYGRIKDETPAHLTASCWRHPNVGDRDLPEYTHLAPIFTNEPDLRQWLHNERLHFPLCSATTAGPWPYDNLPEPLPTPFGAQPAVIVSNNP
jgi:hypothetical protein